MQSPGSPYVPRSATAQRAGSLPRPSVRRPHGEVTKTREVVAFGVGSMKSALTRINSRMSNTFSPMSASPGPSQTRTDELSLSHEVDHELLKESLLSPLHSASSGSAMSTPVKVSGKASAVDTCSAMLMILAAGNGGGSL